MSESILIPQRNKPIISQPRLRAGDANLGNTQAIPSQLRRNSCNADLVPSRLLALLVKDVDVPPGVVVVRGVEPKVAVLADGGDGVVVFLCEFYLFEVRDDAVYRGVYHQHFPGQERRKGLCTYLPARTWG